MTAQNTWTQDAKDGFVQTMSTFVQERNSEMIAVMLRGLEDNVRSGRLTEADRNEMMLQIRCTK